MYWVHTHRLISANLSFFHEVITELEWDTLYKERKSKPTVQLNNYFEIMRSEFNCLPADNLDHQAEKYSITCGKIAVILTKREAQCLSHLVKGLSAKMVARELKISPRTVEAHFNNIRTKAKIHTRYELLTKIDNLDIIDQWQFG